jgi:[ribosomal protein S5]-alanine N-acetyltransferase
MRTVTTLRCVLEPQVALHAKEMFAVLVDPAIYEFENSPPVGEQWLQERFRRLEERGPKDGGERWLNWVVRVSSGELAGYVQATVRPEGIAFVAYELNSKYWRHGIGSSAVQGMIDELRSQYGVKECVAVLKTRNYRSMGLLEKLGFLQATHDQSARYRDEPDESVMVKTFDGIDTLRQYASK